MYFTGNYPILTN